MRIVMNPLLTLLAVRAFADKQRACLTGAQSSLSA